MTGKGEAHEAYIEVAVTENLNPRCATGGLVFKENHPPLTAAHSAVGDQRRRIRGRGADEERGAAAAVVCPMIVGKDSGCSSACIISKTYLSVLVALSHKVLCYP